MAIEVSEPIHFVGIGGTGMSGLAELALLRGFSVQGSDLRRSNMTDRLEKYGAKILFNHSASSVQGAKTIVYSSAISNDNIELLEADKTGALKLHRSDFLAWLMQNTLPITIAGTHGKTTSSAMIVHVLSTLGVDPSAVVGGTMRSLNSTARMGRSEWFVAEADESDGSFLKYKPFVSILTNIDVDHMDFYQTEANLLKAFSSYLNNTIPDGTAVVGWDSPLARQVGSEYLRSRLTYGFLLGSEVRAIDVKWNGICTSFTAIVERDRIPVRLRAFGMHNIQNALCSLALARVLSLNTAAAADALDSFQGVERRMALVLDTEELKIFDDYAHNPGKIAACISALRTSYRDFSLHVVYQPHRFTRLETMYDAMLSCLKEATNLYLLPVYAAGETTSQDFSPERLARDLFSKHQIKAIVCQDIKDATQKVLTRVTNPSVILTVGAGDVSDVSIQLRDVYAEPK